MPRYHIGKISGKPEPCNPEVTGKCGLGENELHADSEEQLYSLMAERYSSELFTFYTKDTKDVSTPGFNERLDTIRVAGEDLEVYAETAENLSKEIEELEFELEDQRQTVEFLDRTYKGEEGFQRSVAELRKYDDMRRVLQDKQIRLGRYRKRVARAKNLIKDNAVDLNEIRREALLRLQRSKAIMEVELEGAKKEISAISTLVNQNKSIDADQPTHIKEVEQAKMKSLRRSLDHQEWNQKGLEKDISSADRRMAEIQDKLDSAARINEIDRELDALREKAPLLDTNVLKAEEELLQAENNLRSAMSKVPKETRMRLVAEAKAKLATAQSERATVKPTIAEREKELAAIYDKLR